MGVLLFHFGANWLPGGFVGVDVFFVISGFVISKSIYRDIDARKFSLSQFFERRLRRIFPAFAAVTIATTVVAYFRLFDTDLVDYAKSVIASSLFVSNFYFYSLSGYFAPEAIRIPLLHYWSLGVEEQFYIFLPLMLICVHWLRKEARVVTILILAAVSFVACIIVRHKDPALAFYGSPFRAFELLTGCMLALPQMRFPKDATIAAASAGLGIIAIVASMLLIKEGMPFPGYLTLFPCLGTALIIYGGEFIQTAPIRFLSWRPFVIVGGISYPLYLVHWPIVVFMKMAHPNIAPVTFAWICGTLSLLSAAALYKFIEQPFRTKIVLHTSIPLWSAASLCAFIMIGAASAAIKLGGFPNRLSPEINKILAYKTYHYADVFREGTCFLRENQVNIDVETCMPHRKPDVVIWGDSVMAHYALGLEHALTERGVTFGQLTSSGCQPIVGVEIPVRPNCKPFNDAAFAEILKVKPDTLVMGSIWPDFNSEADLFDKELNRIVSAGIRVIIVGPPIYYKDYVPIILARRRMNGNLDDTEENDRSPRFFPNELAIQQHLKDNHKVKYFSTEELFCKPQCKLAVGDIPLHYDTHHFSHEGSDFFARLLVEAIFGD